MGHILGYERNTFLVNFIEGFVENTWFKISPLSFFLTLEFIAHVLLYCVLYHKVNLTLQMTDNKFLSFAFVLFSQ